MNISVKNLNRKFQFEPIPVGQFQFESNQYYYRNLNKASKIHVIVLEYKIDSWKDEINNFLAKKNSFEQWAINEGFGDDVLNWIKNVPSSIWTALTDKFKSHNPLDWLQGCLDILGIVPIFPGSDMVADGLNFGIYWWRGMTFDAVLSLISVIPGMDFFAKGMRLMSKTVGRFFNDGIKAVAKGDIKALKLATKYLNAPAEVEGAKKLISLLKRVSNFLVEAVKKFIDVISPILPNKWVSFIKDKLNYLIIRPAQDIEKLGEMSSSLLNDPNFAKIAASETELAKKIGSAAKASDSAKITKTFVDPNTGKIVSGSTQDLQQITKGAVREAENLGLISTTKLKNVVLSADEDAVKNVFSKISSSPAFSNMSKEAQSVIKQIELNPSKYIELKAPLYKLDDTLRSIRDQLARTPNGVKRFARLKKYAIFALKNWSFNKNIHTIDCVIKAISQMSKDVASDLAMKALGTPNVQEASENSNVVSAECGVVADAALKGIDDIFKGATKSIKMETPYGDVNPQADAKFRETSNTLNQKAFDFMGIPTPAQEIPSQWGKTSPKSRAYYSDVVDSNGNARISENPEKSLDDELKTQVSRGEITQEEAMQIKKDVLSKWKNESSMSNESLINESKTKKLNSYVKGFEDYIIESDERLRVENVQPKFPGGKKAIIITLVADKFDKDLAVKSFKENAPEMADLISSKKNEYFIVYDTIKDGQRKGIFRQIFGGNKRIWSVRFELVYALDGNGNPIYSKFNTSPYLGFVPSSEIENVKVQEISNAVVQNAVQQSETQISNSASNVDVEDVKQITSKPVNGNDSVNVSNIATSNVATVTPSATSSTQTAKTLENLSSTLDSLVGIKSSPESTPKRSVEVLQNVIALIDNDARTSLNQNSLRGLKYDGIYGPGTSVALQMTLGLSSIPETITEDVISALKTKLKQLGKDKISIGELITSVRKKNSSEIKTNKSMNRQNIQVSNAKTNVTTTQMSNKNIPKQSTKPTQTQSQNMKPSINIGGKTIYLI